MGRRLKIDRPIRTEINLPLSIYEKVRQELYSEIEGKVPFGAISTATKEAFTLWLAERGIIV